MLHTLFSNIFWVVLLEFRVQSTMAKYFIPQCNRENRGCRLPSWSFVPGSMCLLERLAWENRSWSDKSYLVFRSAQKMT